MQLSWSVPQRCCGFSDASVGPEIHPGQRCASCLFERLLGSRVLLALQVRHVPRVACTGSTFGDCRGPSSSRSCAALFRHLFLALRAAVSCIRLLVTAGVSCLLGVVLALRLSSLLLWGFVEEVCPFALFTFLLPAAMLLQLLDPFRVCGSTRSFVVGVFCFWPASGPECRHRPQWLVSEDRLRSQVRLWLRPSLSRALPAWHRCFSVVRCGARKTLSQRLGGVEVAWSKRPPILPVLLPSISSRFNFAPRFARRSR